MIKIVVSKTIPASIKDQKNVYLGGESPSFGPVRKPAK